MKPTKSKILESQNKVLKLIQRGAEAELFQTTFMHDKSVIKRRNQKGYRDPALDKELQVQRTRKEVKMLIEAKTAGVRTPLVYAVSSVQGEITMEFLDGKKVKDVLNKHKDVKGLCKTIGKRIAQLHENNLVHGDLTTSNFIMLDKDVGFIDFGLGKTSLEVEDKAVDLLNLKKTMESTHVPVFEVAWKAVTDGYNPKNKKAVLERLEEVERRARYL